MIPKLFSALLVAGVTLAGAVQAQTVGYECQMDTTSGQNGWMPEVLFIGHDQKTDEVFVSDPIILYYNDKKPIEGRVKTDNAKRTTFAWKLKVKSGTNQYATFKYSATYLKSSGVMTMSGLPLGYMETFNSKGRCEVKPIR